MTWIASPDVSRRGGTRSARSARSTSAHVAFVRSWTGRAATSRATDSGLPHLVTAGTHRTRVSEMRTAAAAGRRHSVTGVPGGPAAVAPAITARRALARRRSDHIGSGG
jgi:hypothetical protein